ncbi:MAG TPA: tetratricopeptide repeat protein [Vicinamibacterales bacterium]|jgi:tetratricopeptide (TPR) repeat protein|nr:tetratricopeptide repeat protein [Vicinamibacterales bacterium]
MHLPLLAAASLAAVIVALQPSSEATSLLGKPLISPPLPDTVGARLEADLTAARAALERAPNNADARIWVGRRLGYLGRYRDAIAVFTEGIERFPKDARFLRHRGHRYITVREFDKAIADLERADALVAGSADQIEPDGQPNDRNIPLTTLHSNIRYHLALAYYLKGDFAKAAPVWQRARDAVRNPDNLVSATHWLYLTLRRMGRDDEATRALDGIVPGLDVIENGSYYSLCQLYKGVRTADDVLKAAGGGPSGAAVVYGVAVWHDLNGRTADATALRQQLVDGPDWAPFGVIAAEADLARKK